MRVGIAAGIASVFLVAGCGGDDEATDALTPTPDVVVASEEAPPATQESEPDPTASATQTPAVVAGDRAFDCVPGTWVADMDQLVSTFQTPGNPTYVDGAYTFTFSDDLTFDAVGSDVTFRLTNQDGYVDVHNSWQESGLWGAANDQVTFDEVLLILGLPGEFTANDYAVTLGVEETALVGLVGDSYAAGENYGMVNGSIRTPPLSDEGAPITASGFVECAADRMTLFVSGSGWSGNFDLTKQSG